MRFWRDSPKKRNVHKPKKRVVPTYRGMGMSLTSRNHLSVDREKKVLDDMSIQLIEDLKRPTRETSIGTRMGKRKIIVYRGMEAGMFSPVKGAEKSIIKSPEQGAAALRELIEELSGGRELEF